MRSEPFLAAGGRLQAGTAVARLPLAARQAVITAILFVAMLAFELFNFETSRFALFNLLGNVSFGGVSWAAILALALCAVDFAGLAHLCAPESALESALESGQESRAATLYLMAAWLLGATMNALMTWWAITLTLLNHPFGNELLSRAQILEIAPLLVAGFVWLTRILFIGAFALSADPAAEGQRAAWNGRAAQSWPAAPRPALPPGMAQPRRPALLAAPSARGRPR